MTRVDQFESVFRSAARTVFVQEQVEVGSVLVISNLDPEGADDFAAKARGFLDVLDQTENIRWRIVHGSEGHLVQRAGPRAWEVY